VNRHATLLHNGMAGCSQFVCKGILIRLSHESGPKGIQHGECAADRLPRQIVQRVAIRVHPRASSYICVLSLPSQPADGWFSIDPAVRTLLPVLYREPEAALRALGHAA
jgi:hypothetical protein